MAEDEVVAEIETDKTSMPVPSPAHGIIEELLVENGASVKNGQQLFKLKVTGEKPAAAPAKKEAPAAAPAPAAAAGNIFSHRKANSSSVLIYVHKKYSIQENL